MQQLQRPGSCWLPDDGHVMYATSKQYWGHPSTPQLSLLIDPISIIPTRINSIQSKNMDVKRIMKLNKPTSQPTSSILISLFLPRPSLPLLGSSFGGIFLCQFIGSRRGEVAQVGPCFGPVCLVAPLLSSWLIHWIFFEIENPIDDPYITKKNYKIEPYRNYDCALFGYFVQRDLMPLRIIQKYKTT